MKSRKKVNEYESENHGTRLFNFSIKVLVKICIAQNSKWCHRSLVSSNVSLVVEFVNKTSVWQWNLNLLRHGHVNQSFTYGMRQARCHTIVHENVTASIRSGPGKALIVCWSYFDFLHPHTSSTRGKCRKSRSIRSFKSHLHQDAVDYGSKYDHEFRRRWIGRDGFGNDRGRWEC